MKELIYLVLAVLMAGCFTGIENTGKISDRDVAKVKADRKTAEELFMDTVSPSGFIQWKPGKRFYVNDNNVRLIFDPSSSYDVDTLQLKGTGLEYAGYKYVRHIDNTESVVISFKDGKNTYYYNTGKTIAEVEEMKPEYLVPFLTDMDYVQAVDGMLAGRTLYIKTFLWSDGTMRLRDALCYVPVVIDAVVPGDVVYPFFVKFDYQGRKAGVFMSSSASSIRNMTFDKLFSFTDIRHQYPSITDENWERIVKGEIAVGMTKSECTLALGSPRTIDRMPTHGGMYERWSYDNGVYLVFENGLLSQYRQ